MTGLSETVIYLLVVLIEVLQPSEPVTVDYLQNLSPAMEISITPLEQSDNDVYLIAAEPVRRADAESRATGNDGMSSGPIRIEQSDLYSHNYIAYTPGRLPYVMDLTAVRRQLTRVSARPAPGRIADLSFDFTQSSTDGSGESSSEPSPEMAPDTPEFEGPPLSGPVHLLTRGAVVLLAAETDGVLLTAR